MSSSEGDVQFEIYETEEAWDNVGMGIEQKIIDISSVRCRCK